MGLLLDKNAVVYGAGGAIGGAVARTFAREIVATGGVAETAQVDALDEHAVGQHVDAVTAKTGRIDVLFNAVGMEDVQGTPLLEMSLRDFLHPITVAASTQFLTARAVARRMVEKGACGILTLVAGPQEALPY